MRKSQSAAIGALLALLVAAPASASSYLFTFDDLELGTVIDGFTVVEDPAREGKSLRGDLSYFVGVPLSSFGYWNLPSALVPLPDLPENTVYVVTRFQLYFPQENFGGPHGPRIMPSTVAGAIYPIADVWFDFDAGNIWHPAETFIRAGNDIYLDNFSIETQDYSAFVPEPATWALLIAGFGLSGVVLRRKSASVEA